VAGFGFGFGGPGSQVAHRLPLDGVPQAPGPYISGVAGAAPGGGSTWELPPKESLLFVPQVGQLAVLDIDKRDPSHKRPCLEVPNLGIFNPPNPGGPMVRAQLCCSQGGLAAISSQSPRRCSGRHRQTRMSQCSVSVRGHTQSSSPHSPDPPGPSAHSHTHQKNQGPALTAQLSNLSTSGTAAHSRSKLVQVGGNLRPTPSTTPTSATGLGWAGWGHRPQTWGAKGYSASPPPLLRATGLAGRCGWGRGGM
jgi:hypothetical protein